MLVWSLAVVVDDEPGFGGTDPSSDEVASSPPSGGGEDDDGGGAAVLTPAAPTPPSRPDDFQAGAVRRTLERFPEQPAVDTATPTPLELELARGGLDPGRHPLLALRVEVARARQAYEAGRQHGLYSLRDEEETLSSLEALLADVERIALHRMNVCMTRQGKNVVVRNYRMTAAGPVTLTVQELLAQASPIDPDGCSRISLIDAALIERVRRAHSLTKELSTRRFGFHEMAQRRALEKEHAAVRAELAKEDLPVLSLPGGTDPHRSR